ncbi:transporter substrate-binding domain-containing protein [Anaerovibrio lipolyticus]|uniref:ATP-binding protein n=1 Tax=Anaerovibrio lipolyticus TaxID=82374 RepID=UPI0025CCD7D8|nr:transporter substrate-binding domain-containing protein [Anaerovibrio lipolyticus]
MIKVIEMMKRLLFICVFLLLSVFTGCSPQPVEVSPTDMDSGAPLTGKVVKVGYFSDGNFMGGASQGAVKSGYGYEYLQAVANYTGWRYEYVYGSWSELYKKLLSGEIDLMTDVSYTPERAGLINYPKDGMGREIYYIAVKTDNNQIDSMDLSTFNGKKIGVEEKSVQIKYLEDWIEKNNIDCEIVPMGSGTDNKIKALMEGKIDALVRTHFRGKVNGISNIVLLGDSDYYLVTAPKRTDLLEELNLAQPKIMASHPYFWNDMEYKHFKDAMMDSRLSPDDREWLNNKKYLRIGYFSRHLPLCARGTNGDAPQGVITTVMNDICKNIEVDPSIITYVPFDDSDSLKNAVIWGDVDAAFGFYKDLWWAEKVGLSQTNDIFTIGLRLIIREDFDVNDIKRIAIAKNKPSPTSIMLAGIFNGDYEYVYYESEADCYEAVKRGKVDATISNEYLARTFLQKNNAYRGLKEVDTFSNAGVCLSVNRNNSHLLSIFERGIVNLDQQKIDKEISANVFSLVRSNLHDLLLDYWWILVILGVVFLLILVNMYILNRSRQRISKVNQVLREQTNQLKVANDELIMANEHQVYANEELLAKNDEVKELLDKQHKAITIIENNHEALKSANWIIEFDPVGNVDNVNWSDGLRHILGYTDANDFPDTLEAVVGLIHPEDRLEGGKYIWEILRVNDENINIVDHEIRIKTTDRDYVWFRAYARLNRRSDGTPLRLYGVLQDISDYKNMIAQKDEALLKAQQANQAKSIFLNNMSHDIRTPMNGIMGYTALAEENLSNSAEVKTYLEKIKLVSKHLLSLINDVLDMSRIESGRIELEPQPTNLISLVDELKSILQSDVEMKKLQFQVDTNGIMDDTVLCDRLRLKQVLLNLLSNAVKFTPAGGLVSIKLFQKPASDANRSTFEFHVEDTGIGIEKDFIERLFVPFERARNTTVSGIQGTGLGMSITKSIVDIMGGTITVDSEPNKGTKFIVSVEFKTIMHQDADVTVRTKDKYDFTGKSVLLVEDNVINQEIANALLEGVNFKVDVAGNGSEALEKMKKARDGQYDVILMDIQMPVMDGYEATEAIRALDSDYCKKVPIIAMTANVFAEDKLKAMNAGMNGHVGKPIDIRELFSTLKSMLTN